MKFPKLKNGNYTLANEGTQIFTKQQTDNLWHLAKIDPWKLLSISTPSIHELNPPVAKVETQGRNNPINVQIGNMVGLNGTVYNCDEKTMKQVADKSVDKLVKQLNDMTRFNRC